MLLELLKLLFPFIKEIIIGKQRSLTALKNSKRRFFFLIIVMISFAANFIMGEKLIKLSYNNFSNNIMLSKCKENYDTAIELTNKYQFALNEIKELKSNSCKSNIGTPNKPTTTVVDNKTDIDSMLKNIDEIDKGK